MSAGFGNPTGAELRLAWDWQIPGMFHTLLAWDWQKRGQLFIVKSGEKNGKNGKKCCPAENG